MDAEAGLSGYGQNAAVCGQALERHPLFLWL
jgi:hypothetical protein